MASSLIAFCPCTPLQHGRRASLTWARNVSTRPRLVRTCQPKRRALVRMSENFVSGGGGAESEPSPLTVSDALRAWSRAREAGITPTEENSAEKNSIGVLFLDRDNVSVGVVMEAIFSDLVSRRAPKLHIYCHSAGTRVNGFRTPDPAVTEALKFKRGIDVSSHTSCQLTLSDLESFDLIVCSDEATRSEALLMTTDGNGTISLDLESKFVVISSYCSQERLRATQFKDGKYSKAYELNFLLSGIIDACTGLLSSLLDAPRQ
jgi:protein-tyrosine-phosphatase